MGIPNVKLRKTARVPIELNRERKRSAGNQLSKKHFAKQEEEHERVSDEDEERPAPETRGAGKKEHGGWQKAPGKTKSAGRGKRQEPPFVLGASHKMGVVSQGMTQGTKAKPITNVYDRRSTKPGVFEGGVGPGVKRGR